MKKKLILISFLCSVLMANALAEKKSGSWDLAFDLMRAEMKAGENCCVSPYSLQMALAMTQEGATGKTKRQISALLPKNLLANSEKMQNSVSLTQANSIWISDKIAADVKPKFVSQNKEKYVADVRRLTFDANAVRQMNAWCSEKTRGLIPSVIDRLSPQDVMVLMNALYFKADWVENFDPNKTQKMPFNVANGEAKLVDMMSRSGRMTYAETKDCQVVRLNYKASAKNGENEKEKTQFAMYVLLPKAGIGTSAILKKLSEKSWKQLPFSEQKVHLQLPKWESNYGTSLVGALQKMGATRMFAANAQFSKICKQKLCVSDIIQKCVVKVNETGTEAAAVTAVMMRLTSAGPNQEKPIEMNVNRPFIYVLAETTTDTPLFIGIMNK